jgi:N-acetylmuramoyl-L-alanine amidase
MKVVSGGGAGVRLGLLFYVLAFSAFTGAEVLRAPVLPGAAASLQDGRLFLECYMPAGSDARTFYGPLVPDGEWSKYTGRKAVAIRAENVRTDVRRQMLLALFPRDMVDESGWWHTPSPRMPESRQFMQTFCGWLTGNPSNADAITAKSAGYVPGQQILIPAKLLLPEFRKKSAPPISRPPSEEPSGPSAHGNGEEHPVDPEQFAGELTYGKDDRGEYALYLLKPGEALYSAVVVRFTDIGDNDDIKHACDVIQKRSGIRDVTDMKSGQKIYIPLEMLSDRYTPKGSATRQEFEQTIEEAKRLRKSQVRSRDLEGVVVVVDPGHGGRDHGAQNAARGLYEDEINYDIACRVKKLLETQTRAKVYMTLRDPNQGFEPSNCSVFSADKDEEVLTTPPYPNEDSKISANLRWYLANSIYRRENKKGIDARKMVFTSFHTDALYNSSMRGAMIYIPGANYRRASEQPEGVVYARYEEVRERRTSASSDSERRRDEAMSRNLAEDVMETFGKMHVRRHMEGDWIRNKIRQDGGRTYLPAVLRNTLIPTKILIESANMTNETDCQRLADPQWRQSVAEAYVQALKKYF